jgi:hypothetical protein
MSMLKYTPIWDDLGCSGIPREGVGKHRLIGKQELALIYSKPR